MNILERQQEAISRLFGTGAVLGGSMGSRLGPGVAEIRIDGVTAGRGPTLGDAITEASKALSAIARRAAA